MVLASACNREETFTAFLDGMDSGKALTLFDTEVKPPSAGLTFIVDKPNGECRMKAHS